MNDVTTNYLTRAETWLIVTTLFYFLLNGAQIFETVVLVPKWTADPPKTFAILTDKNGASLKTFWILFHSLHEVTFILAIVFCWQLTEVRNWLLMLFTMHFAVRVWTILYFAPTIIGFQNVAETPALDSRLKNKVFLWQKLNYLRVFLFIAVSVGLIPVCMKVFDLKRI